MTSDIANTKPRCSQPFELHSTQFSIDGNTDCLKYIVTEHGEGLVLAIDFVVSFVGCTSKDASNKISSLYNLIPQLRPPKQELRHYSKVCIHLFIEIQQYHVLILDFLRLLWSSWHMLIIRNYF